MKPPKCKPREAGKSGRGLTALQNAGAVVESVAESARFWSAVSPLPLLLCWSGEKESM